MKGREGGRVRERHCTHHPNQGRVNLIDWTSPRAGDLLLEGHGCAGGRDGDVTHINGLCGGRMALMTQHINVYSSKTEKKGEHEGEGT